jgi:hypothetical protein
MVEGRLSKIALKWRPKQKTARGRPNKNWMEGTKKAMDERNLKESQWEDRKQWSLGVGQCKKVLKPILKSSKEIWPVLIHGTSSVVLPALT